VSERWGEGARPRPGLMALAALAAVLLFTGCSVGVQKHPAVVGPGPLRSPSPTTLQDGTSANRIEVFLVHGDKLTGVYRPAPEGRTVHGALRALTAPLDSSEQAAGFRSALPGSAGPLRAQVRAGIVYVPVPEGFQRLGVSEQVLAVGQITDTVTRVPGVNGVQLTHGGNDVDIPVAGGQLVPGPVTAADYAPVTAPEPTARPRSTTHAGASSTARSPSGSRS